jgi:hypothetical protein
MLFQLPRSKKESSSRFIDFSESKKSKNKISIVKKLKNKILTSFFHFAAISGSSKLLT